MLNEDLINVSKEECFNLKRENLKLKELIKKYKKHDENRTKYYASKMQELGELQSLINEFKDTDKLWNKCINYKKEISILSKKIYLQKLIELSDEDIFAISEYQHLKAKYDKLNRLYKSLRNSHSELIYKLYNNENQDN